MAPSAIAEPLSDGELGAQLAYSALHCIDWAQTRNIARHSATLEEKNRLLGAHPSVRKVDAYMASTLAAHWGITYALPERWRAPWQGASIALEAGVVAHNWHVDIAARW